MSQLLHVRALRQNQSTRNANGITYKRWLAAAGRSKSSTPTHRAWAAGEDPSEWRMTHEKVQSIWLASAAALKNAVRRTTRRLKSKR